MKDVGPWDDVGVITVSDASEIGAARAEERLSGGSMGAGSVMGWALSAEEDEEPGRRGRE